MMERLFATALHALTVEVGKETFIVDLREGTSIALNGAAAAIWRGLVQGSSPAQVAREVAAGFGVDETRAQSDVAAFVATLSARGFVSERLLAPSGGDDPPLSR